MLAKWAQGVSDVLSEQLKIVYDDQEVDDIILHNRDSNIDDHSNMPLQTMSPPARPTQMSGCRQSDRTAADESPFDHLVV
jgi:hypothetical protein